MKMEKNKKTLDRAIAALPQYQPPDFLWEDLADRLDFEQDLEKPLREMPVYNPPADLWEELAIKIEQTPELAQKPETNHRFKWFGLAFLLFSGILMLFLMLFLMVKNRPEMPSEKQNLPAAPPEQPRVEQPMARFVPESPQNRKRPKQRKKQNAASGPALALHLRTEVVDNLLLMACQQTDDPNFSILETLCREALPVCEEPQFKQLKAELDELNNAHTALKNALGNFADDPEMVAQLIEIERSRNQILQQLITMI